MPVIIADGKFMLTVAINFKISSPAEFLKVRAFITGIKISGLFIEDAPAGGKGREGNSEVSRHRTPTQ